MKWLEEFIDNNLSAIVYQICILHILLNIAFFRDVSNFNLILDTIVAGFCTIGMLIQTGAGPYSDY